jgi:NADH-quinone oxidoreductase subunit L
VHEAVPSHEAEDEHTELLLMGVSSGLALAGIGLAAYFWLRNRPAATRAARGATPVYTLLLNKYYVDEIYNAVIVQPIKAISTFVLWKGFDALLIDGAVNGVGGFVRGSSDTLRRLQTGSIRAYAASLFFGVVLILGWYLLR